MFIAGKLRWSSLFNKGFGNMPLLLCAVVIYLFSPMNLWSQNVGLDWVKQIRNKEIMDYGSEGYGIATDHNGDVLTTGIFNGKVNFNPGTQASDTFFLKGNNRGVYISKLDNGGHFIWAKFIKATTGNGIAVDKDNNIYITGDFNGTVDFNPGAGVYNMTYIGYWRAAFILKLNSRGEFLWARKIEEAYTANITVDHLGNCLVTGSIGGTGFVAKYDTDGNQVLQKKFERIGMESQIQFDDIVTNKSGDILMSGYFSGTIDFDPDTSVYNVNATLGIYIFILKLDASGKFSWVKAMGSAAIPGYITINTGWAINVDAWDNVLVTGKFNFDVDFNLGNTPPLLLNGGRGSAFILKLRNNGDVAWAKTLGALSFGYDIDSDQSGNIYTGGQFWDTINLDPGNGSSMFTSRGGADIFINKLDSSGNFIWGKRLGGTRADMLQAMVVDPSRNIYSTGYFQGTANYDPGPDTFTLSTDTIGKNGGNSIFIHKLSCRDTNSSDISVTTCETSYVFNGVLYNHPGLYKQIVPNVTGCDSTISLNLNFTTVDQPVINVEVFVLGTTGTYRSYQWFLNGVAIPGANSRTYTVEINGNYTVIVTGENDCSDTSEVYKVTNVTGIDDLLKMRELITVSPNPTRDILNIKSPFPVAVSLTAIDGRQMLKEDKTNSISLKSIPAGIYFLNILDQKGRLLKVEKVLKE